MSDHYHEYTEPYGDSSNFLAYPARPPPSRHAPQSLHRGPPGHSQGRWQSRPDQSSVPRVAIYPPDERWRQPKQPPQPYKHQFVPRRHEGTGYGDHHQYYHEADKSHNSGHPSSQSRGQYGRPAQRQPPPRPRRPDQHDSNGSGPETGNQYTASTTRAPPSMIPRPIIEALPQMPRRPSPDAKPRVDSYDMASRRPSPGPPPSARRGPATYYPKIGPVTSIPEESEVRGSVADFAPITNVEDLPPHRSTSPVPMNVIYNSNKHAQSSANLLEYQYGTGLEDPPAAVTKPEHQQLHEQHSRSRVPEAVSHDKTTDASDLDAGIVEANSIDQKQEDLVTVVRGNRVKRLSIETATQLAVDGDHEAHPGDQNVTRLSGTRRHTDGSASIDSSNGSPIAVTAPTSPTSSKSRHSKSGLSARTSSSEALVRMDDSQNYPSSAIDEAPRSRLSVASDIASTPLSKHPISRSKSPLLIVKPPEGIPSETEKTDGPNPASEQDRLPLPTPGFSGRPGATRPRPPLLNVDSIRTTEVRGSLTSLPDLIVRATKLASNLDRGRTASRLGINWMGTEEEKRASDRHSSGLSDILASFPSPAVATPPVSRAGHVRRSAAHWSARNRHSELYSNSEASHESKQARRYCGFTLWKFVLVLIVLFLLLVAAIVVPVVLVVLPRQKSHDTDSSSTQIANCEKAMMCENGGATAFTNGVCGCICINGFTGPRCGSASQQGCTTTSIGSTNNVTVGSAIPRIISNAQSEFGIPLDGQTLLGLFSDADLSCNTENALVTFTNVVRRDIITSPVMNARDEETTANAGAAATSNGIIFATSTVSALTATTTTPSLASASQQASNSTATTDFARTAVLYVFQVSGQLATAVTAQSNLQDYFANSTSSIGTPLQAANLTLGNGFACDLDLLQLRLANGTVVK